MWKTALIKVGTALKETIYMLLNENNGASYSNQWDNPLKGLNNTCDYGSIKASIYKKSMIFGGGNTKRQQGKRARAYLLLCNCTTAKSSSSSHCNDRITSSPAAFTASLSPVHPISRDLSWTQLKKYANGTWSTAESPKLKTG